MMMMMMGEADDAGGVVSLLSGAGGAGAGAGAGAGVGWMGGDSKGTEGKRGGRKPPQQADRGGAPRNGRRGSPQAFARKLWDMLLKESTDVLRWTEDGLCVQIVDMQAFERETLPRYFNSAKFSSFQRQLNLYGFRKLAKGPDAGAYQNTNFRRGHPELLHLVTRAPQAAIGSRAPAHVKRALAAAKKRQEEGGQEQPTNNNTATSNNNNKNKNSADVYVPQAPVAVAPALSATEEPEPQPQPQPQPQELQEQQPVATSPPSYEQHINNFGMVPYQMPEQDEDQLRRLQEEQEQQRLREQEYASNNNKFFGSPQYQQMLLQQQQQQQQPGMVQPATSLPPPSYEMHMNNFGSGMAVMAEAVPQAMPEQMPTTYCAGPVAPKPTYTAVQPAPVQEADPLDTFAEMYAKADNAFLLEAEAVQTPAAPSPVPVELDAKLHFDVQQPSSPAAGGHFDFPDLKSPRLPARDSFANFSSDLAESLPDVADDAEEVEVYTIDLLTLPPRSATQQRS